MRTPTRTTKISHKNTGQANIRVKSKKLQKVVASDTQMFVLERRMHYLECLTFCLSQISLLLRPYLANQTKQVYILPPEIGSLAVFTERSSEVFLGGPSDVFAEGVSQTFKGVEANTIFSGWAMFRAFIKKNIFRPEGWESDISVGGVPSELNDKTVLLFNHFQSSAWRGPFW